MAAKLYLLTLELVPDDPYPRLQAWLRSMNAQQILVSQWAIRTVHSAQDIKRMVRQRIHDADRVMVAEVGPDWASRRAMTDLRPLLKLQPVTRRIHRGDGRG